MDIPLSILLLLCLIFVLIGAVVMLLLQYYVYIKISNVPEESSEQKEVHVKYSLPLAIQETARAIKTGTLPTVAALTSLANTTSQAAKDDADKSPLVALNFIMQFLFHELKNRNRVRKWFYRKLSLELDELLAKTTTGKLFDKLTIKELELGDQFPEIKALHVSHVDLDDVEGRIENLDLILDLHYMGNFRTTIDADMVLGKKGSLTLKVKQLSGLARLQFTRVPYTHWSLSFLGDPKLDLAVDSKYQGRQMQSNITSLISNQIRKAVRRKHTLPNYKLRYKPFFHKTPEDDSNEAEGIIPNGTLEVKISEISRLMTASNVSDVYCTLTMASLSFVESRQRDDRNVIISLNVEVRKAKNQQIGIVFKQTSEHLVEIDAVLPNTPACKSDLRSGDVLIAIEGKPVNSIQQVAKLVKSMQISVFSLRIERVIPGIIRNDAILEDLELYEDMGDLRTNYSFPQKPMEPESAIKQIVARTIDKNTSSESSLSNTPTSSPKKSKFIPKALKKSMSRDSCEHSKEDDGKSRLKLLSRIEERARSPPKLPNIEKGIHEVEHFHQHSTIDCILTSHINMEDLSMFKLNSNSKFLNVCLYGKSPGESTLIGYVNIPIVQLLAESLDTSLNQILKTFELRPPMPQDLSLHPLYNQSGFEPDLCFGDILCAFVWEGNTNLEPFKNISRTKIRSSNTSDKNDDSAMSDTMSIKSETLSASTPRLHNFVRTHFQRATQCDFCGKKIWLKDAVQCRECCMSCHKKCVTKCQNSTVCGPVDLTTPTMALTPEFTVTESHTTLDTSEGEEVLVSGNEEDQAKTPTTNSLDVSRGSLTGLLAEGIKRVNSANNLAIPGIVSTLTGGSSISSLGNAKSLPPSPQHSGSRKSSLGNAAEDSFEIAIKLLEELPSNLSTLQVQQVNSITEPIIEASIEVDTMSLAKNLSKYLYINYTSTERVEKINLLLGKLRLIMDFEAKAGTISKPISSTSNETISERNPEIQLEDKMQALSVIMLYLCSGLQAAQGVTLQ